MSTDKVELTLDENTNTSIEEESKTQENTTVATDETRVSVSENDNTVKSTDEVRPEWLPEKFANAEDLAKAYSELEKKQSTEPNDPSMQQMRADAEAKEDKTFENETASGMDKYYNEFQEKGELTSNSYEELSKMGLDKSLVDGYITGQKAIADGEVKQIHDTVGGQENYTKVIEFAQTLEKPEQDAFNQTLDNGSIEQVKMAVQAIASRAGVSGQPQSKMIDGDTIGTASDTFESVAQVTEAMNDPRYAKDPAFRKLVETKLARSSQL